MTKYTNATPFTHVYDKFKHYLEDMDDCSLCANFKPYGGRDGRGCGRSACEFQDLKDEAIKNNRIKRPRGWNKPCQTE